MTFCFPGDLLGSRWNSFSPCPNPLALPFPGGPFAFPLVPPAGGPTPPRCGRGAPPSYWGDGGLPWGLTSPKCGPWGVNPEIRLRKICGEGPKKMGPFFIAQDAPGGLGPKNAPTPGKSPQTPPAFYVPVFRGNPSATPPWFPEEASGFSEIVFFLGPGTKIENFFFFVFFFWGSCFGGWVFLFFIAPIFLFAQKTNFNEQFNKHKIQNLVMGGCFFCLFVCWLWGFHGGTRGKTCPVWEKSPHHRGPPPPPYHHHRIAHSPQTPTPDDFPHPNQNLQLMLTAPNPFLGPTPF